MEANEIVKWKDSKALARYQIIAPLLDESLDLAKKIELRKKLQEEHNISERTIRRYLNRYQETGFEGLKPLNHDCRNKPNGLPDNFDEILEQAKLLKREVPTRSVNQIILILELEGWVDVGVLKRSTLQRHLFNAGFGKKQLKKYNDARKSSSKRFCKPNRMMLVQGDIKYGPYLPIGKNGAKKRTYLSAVIDDHSRYILASGFYDNQEKEIVEDTVHKAILKYGKVDAFYMDNGKQYISRQLAIAASKLGITIRHAAPYACQSKGKIEKYNRLVNSFITEANVKKIKTLKELNAHWQNFVEVYYHQKPHEGIREYYQSLNTEVPDEGITPEQEWNRDSRALVFLDANVVGEAFLHHEKRLVDKGACISFQNRKYEVSTSLIGATVEISYDPMSTDEITVSYPGIDDFKASPLRIGSFCDKKPEIPACMLTKEPETSRFLDALAKKAGEQKQIRANAISFGAYKKQGGEG